MFAAIDMPATVKSSVSELINLLRTHAHDEGLSITWLPPTSIHLTLAFVAKADPSGLNDISSSLEEVAGQFRQFQLVVGGAGAFPSVRQPSSVWLGISGGGGAIGALAKSTRNAFSAIGYPQPERQFTPHLTIARIREPREIGGLVDAAAHVSIPPFLVSEMKLFESRLGGGPPQYRCIRSFQLAD